jgi:hypothetical protein
MDEAGNLLSGVTVYVDAEATDAPTAQTLWASREVTDASQYANPIEIESGILDFWVNEPERLKLTVVKQGRPDQVVYIDALPSGSEIVQSLEPLRITNTPTPGDVLVGGAIAGEAEWDTAPAAVLTSTTPGTDYEFTSGSIPGAITQVSRYSGVLAGEMGYLEDATADPNHGTQPALVVETIVDAPTDPAFTYTKAIRIDGQVGETDLTNCARLAPTMADGGRVELWVRVASTPGEASTILAVQPVSFDGYENFWVRRVAFDPSQSGEWVHLLIEVPDTDDGLVEVLIGETNSSSNAASSTLLAQIQPISGGVIPPHNHPGTGLNSLVVGSSAIASGDYSVAAGVNAEATQNYNVAIGYDAEATGADSMAIGATSRATAAQTTAIGYSAEATVDNGLAVGYESEASAVQGSAVGHTARATAADATAVGAQAIASGAGSVALGAESSAGASSSVAIGARAVVDPAHANSVAIGKDAATTAQDQIALGSASHLVLVQGVWRNLGDTLIGSADSRVGFFGSAGTIKQEVSGSRDGNVALAALLTALADMGLITDSSVV